MEKQYRRNGEDIEFLDSSKLVLRVENLRNLAKHMRELKERQNGYLKFEGAGENIYIRFLEHNENTDWDDEFVLTRVTEKGTQSRLFLVSELVLILAELG